VAVETGCRGQGAEAWISNDLDHGYLVNSDTAKAWQPPVDRSTLSCAWTAAAPLLVVGTPHFEVMP